MKKILFFTILLVSIASVSAQKIYKYSRELRFLTPVVSFPQVSISGVNQQVLPRFNFSASNRFHYGWGTFGLFGGIVANNTGVISKSDSGIIKRRAYTLGPELGIRLGFPKGAIVLGGEVDFPYQFKEKRFFGGAKFKTTKWFNYDVVSAYLPSVFMGVAYKYLDVKLQYFFGNFYNDKREQVVANYGKANIYAVSFGLNQLFLKNLLKNLGAGKNKKPKPKDDDKEPSNPDPNVIKTSL